MSSQIEKELDFLLKESGKEITTLLAEAVKEGVHLLYQRYISEAYMPGKISRNEAIQLLGGSAIEELDKAWQVVENDIRWGLEGELR